jgi:MFS family permease
MVTAPFIGFLADRFPRKIIMIGGALVWSVATLLTAVTHNFETMLFRHTIVGLGEATFVTVAPSFLADLFSEEKRGRVFGWFYLNIGLGTAVGYALGGHFGAIHGWRYPFYISVLPGFILAAALAFIPEPPRGAKDLLEATSERTSIRGLVHNGAFWTATLGMAMVTFALGGLEAWMPTFLVRDRGLPVDSANIVFGGITAFTAITGTLVGGWMGDKLLLRTKGAYYFVSAVTLLIGVPAMLAAIFIGMGTTVLAVVQGLPPKLSGSAKFRDGMRTGLPIIIAMAIVLVLGLYIPQPLDRIIREAAAMLEVEK